jgi:hypothetical protein
MLEKLLIAAERSLSEAELGPQGAQRARPRAIRGRGYKGVQHTSLQHFSTHFDRQKMGIQHGSVRGSAGSSASEMGFSSFLQTFSRF